MPVIDGARVNPLNQVMSRTFRPLLPAVFLALPVCFSACVGTRYDRTYSYKKNYFKKPADKKEVSAEAILGAVDSKTPPANPDAGPGGLQPGGDIPGLPPAGMPAVPGLDALPPPAAPPAVPPPPAN